MTILGEARGEGKAGMYAVACVILKRVEERKLPATLVCLQKKQFSCWDKGDKPLFKLLDSSEEHLYAMDLAAAVMKGRLKLEYVKHANHYCTLKANPYWAKGKTPVKIIGNHKFFKLD
jgi:spore germination cell wall hydrolase CwlJ-like protein